MDQFFLPWTGLVFLSRLQRSVFSSESKRFEKHSRSPNGSRPCLRLIIERLSRLTKLHGNAGSRSLDAFHFDPARHGMKKEIIFPKGKPFGRTQNECGTGIRRVSRRKRRKQCPRSIAGCRNAAAKRRAFKKRSIRLRWPAGPTRRRTRLPSCRRLHAGGFRRFGRSDSTVWRCFCWVCLAR
jgi:hypothetical protein